MLTMKDGKYHKNMKMKSAIKDQMASSLKKNDENVKNTFDRKKENIGSKDNLNPNSNKANRIKVYEQITNNTRTSTQPIVNNVSKSSTNYLNNKNQQLIKQKQENKTKEKEDKDNLNKKPIVSKTSLSNNLECIVIQETILKNNDSKELLDQFEDYYMEKFLPLEQNAQITKNNLLLIKEENAKKIEQKPKETIYYNVSLNYSLGLNYRLHPRLSNHNLICYHKEFKWFAYVHYNLILIEYFKDDPQRKQLILNDSKVGLSSIKLSLNGKVLYSCHSLTSKYKACSIPPFILFYSYKNNLFNCISQCDYPSNEVILDYSMSPTNSFCIVATIDSSTNSSAYYLSCLDYINNEVLIKTAIGQESNVIKWNNYISGVEFITFSANSYSIWTIITKDVTFKETKREFSLIEKGTSITSLDYTPPLTLKCIIMLLIALSNGTVLVYDYESNLLRAKYTSLDIFQNIGNVCINNIAVTMNSITVFYDNKMRYFRLPLLSKIDNNDLNLFSIKTKFDMEFDSEIISSELNTMLSACQGIIMTSNGHLYYFNFEEERNLRLFHFNPPIHPIKDALIINNNIKQISLQNYANANTIERTNANCNIEGYTIVTSHEKGIVKIWSVPDYYLKFMIDSKEEICVMTSLPNDTKIIISYYSGNIRVIDTTEGKLIGKTSIKAFIGDNNYLKLIAYLPESKYFFCIDNNKNNLHLVTIESYSHLLFRFNLIYSHPSVIKEISLSIKDPFNQFLISDSSNIVKIFSRKYMTIIHDLSFDKSVPRYDCVDTFNVNTFISNSAFPHIVNQLKSQFSPNISKEPHKIYVATSQLIIQRDFHLRSVSKLISFDIPLLNYHIASNSSYLIYVFNESIKYSQFASIENNEPKGNIVSFPFTDKYIASMVSFDNKLVVIAYSFGFSIFELRNIF